VPSEEWRNAIGGNMEERYSSREPRGPRERAPKIFEKTLKKKLFEKEYIRCVMRICRNVGSG